MRTSAITLLALGLLLGLGTGARAEPGSALLGEAELELQQAQRLLEELREDVSKLEAKGFEFIPEERFIDAQVYFDLKHYEKSALLLTSLIEDSRFKRNKRYFEAVKLLGIALFNEKNYQAARRHFETLRTAGVEAELATTFLIEIAAQLNRIDDLRKLAQSIDANTATEGLLYAKGKALFFVGDTIGSASILRRIPAQGEHALKAQYVTGAALVAEKRLEDAFRVFEALVRNAARSDDEKQLLELAYLSLGRLAYELGNFSAAADHYQQIPRQSPYFEQALFEVTHVHLRWAAEREEPEERMRAYTKAEELLDILVSITKDPQLSRDARILRGRISMFLEKYEQAQEAYQEVIEMFASTSSEMTDVAQSPERIDRFFEAMIRGGDASQHLSLFVSQEVINWMRSQPTLGRVVEILTDVARQRDALDESNKIYEQLQYSLTQEAARELFPGFSDCWLKSLEVENRLLTADNLLLDAEAGLTRSQVAGADRARLDQLTGEREKLQQKLATAPRTVGAYRARSQNNLTNLRNMLRDADEQVLRLKAVQDQILAMQKLLKEVKYKGSTMLQVRDEDAMEREIREEGEKLLKLLKEAEGVRSEVEKEMLVAEVADPRGRSEQDVKSRLWSHHGQEATFYIDQSSGLGEKARAGIEKANGLRRDIVSALDRVRRHQEEIDRKAQKQIQYFRRVLAQEKKELERREEELRLAEQAAMSFARRVGAELFLDAKEELVKAVVEADLGLVDLTWKRKENETRRISEIQQERARVVKKLREDLRAIAGDEESE
jgi:tetratricopeptide (TPR) repeat protein